MKLYICSFDSPFGRFYLASSDLGLVRLYFFNRDKFLTELHKSFPEAELEENEDKNREVLHQLREYFAGVRTHFDIPLHLVGSEFQIRVWQELCKVPFGTTVSYKTIAWKIGHPGAVRAVGQANHRNPIPILVPCHRIIGSDGRLVGYGGGLEMKKKLLVHEGALQL